MQRSFVISLVFLGTLALAAEVPTYSHFVRPDGSPTSSCSQAEPCTLARAFALAATPGMPCGSIGTRGRGLLRPGGVGLRAVADVFGGPLREVHRRRRGGGDRAGGGAVGGGLPPDQRPHLHLRNRLERSRLRQVHRRCRGAARAVNVDVDHGRGSLSALRHRIRDAVRVGRARSRSPSARPSTQVELHRCTFWNDTSANKVYVHMCHNAIPVTNDDLYFGRARWGDIIVQGDGLWWENIDVRYVSLTLGAGLLVEPTAARTVVKLSEFRSAAVEMGGNDTLAEDIEIGYAIVQGPAADGCYDQDSNTSGRTARSCWNASGQSGALLLGIIGSSASSGQVVRRAYIHRSWNGAHVAGANTLEDSILWGFPNHNTYGGWHGWRDSIKCRGQLAGFDLSLVAALREPDGGEQPVPPRCLVLDAPTTKRVEHLQIRAGHFGTTSRPAS